MAGSQIIDLAWVCGVSDLTIQHIVIQEQTISFSLVRLPAVTYGPAVRRSMASLMQSAFNTRRCCTNGLASSNPCSASFVLATPDFAPEGVLAIHGTLGPVWFCTASRLSTA